MNKILLSCVVALGFMMASCGASYTPLTDAQIEAKADSIYQAQLPELEAKLTAKCNELIQK